MISAVLKRDGRLVSFDRGKIDAAILKAFDAVGEDATPVSELAEKVAVRLEERGGIVGVEEIQDVVEHALIDSGFADVAKAYILYREKRSEIRRAKIFFGVRDELKLSVNAVKVLEKRYLLKDDSGGVIESPSQMFFRVAEAVDSNRGHASEFYEVMKNLQFLPNSPTLMNAGAPLGQLSACFTGEQPIVTSTGIKEIKEIKIGDMVLTASGKFAPVVKTMQRHAKGRYAINITKLPNNTLSVTGEHPILALREGKPAWVKVKDLKKMDYVAISYPKEIKDVEKTEVIDFLSDERFTVLGGFVHRKNIDVRLRCGKISKQVKPIKNEIKVDCHFLRLLGYYASEGDIDRKDSLRFTFSENEIFYAKDVMSIAKDKFGLSSKIEKSDHGRWINIRFHSIILSQFFESLMGKGFNKKYVPDWILKLPKEKQIGFIIGSFRGDSTLFMNKNVHNARLVMCNYNLVYAVWAMLIRKYVKLHLPKLIK